jgi:hypothetical protein
MTYEPEVWVGKCSGCGYIADEGKVVNITCASGGRSYSVTYAKGAVIGVLVSYEHRLICFFKNGEYLGVGFKDSPELLSLFVSII